MDKEAITQLFAEVEKTYKDNGALTDEVLSALQFVFQAPLLPALDLVDHHSVTMLQSPSGRAVYQVLGSSGTPYICLTTSDYCSCPAYRFSVLKKSEALMCKHILAVKLSLAMGVCKQQSITDGELAATIKQMD